MATNRSARIPVHILTKTGQTVTGLVFDNGAMNTTTSPDNNQSTDPRPLMNRAIATGTTVIATIEPGQLADPTPCTEMDVRAMLGHLIGVLDRITALGNGDEPFAVVETALADDGWGEGWDAAVQRVAAAWSDDAVLERPMALPWIQGTGAEVLTSYFNEIVVHTWDLATATGQRPDWDEAVVAAALNGGDFLPAEDRLAMFEEISAAIGLDEVAVPFAEALEVPDDAAAIDRLVAWNGRDPNGS